MLWHTSKVEQVTDVILRKFMYQGTDICHCCLLKFSIPSYFWSFYTLTRKNCFRYLKLMSPLNATICTTTYLERQKCYGPDKKILFKKQLFYLEVKGHYGTRHTALWSCTHIPNIIDLSRKAKMLWPGQENTIKKTIIWLWGQRSRSHEGHYGTRHTALWSCTHIPNKYYFKNNYLTLRSKVKVPRKSVQYATHRLMVMHPHTKYHWPVSKDKNVIARTRKYYLKNNYLTLRSKVKIPQRSLQYATHCLMVMHAHTK